MVLNVGELALFVACSQNLSVGLGVSGLEEHLEVSDGCIIVFIVTRKSHYIQFIAVRDGRP